MKKVIVLTAMLSLLLTPALALAADFGLNYGTDLVGSSTKDIRESAIDIVNIVLGVLGIIAVIIVLWGGFTWMTAMGNEEKVTKARQILTAGIIGLIIVMAAYAIARFVISQLETAV